MNIKMAYFPNQEKFFNFLLKTFIKMNDAKKLSQLRIPEPSRR